MFRKYNYITFSCSALLIYVFLLVGQGFVYKQRPPKFQILEGSVKLSPNPVTKSPPLCMFISNGLYKWWLNTTL